MATPKNQEKLCLKQKSPPFFDMRYGVIERPSFRGEQMMMEDFSQGEREVNPSSSEEHYRKLFNQSPNDPKYGPDPGFASLIQDDTPFGVGGNALAVTVQGGNVYMQAYPYSKSNYQWSYAHELVLDGQKYPSGATKSWKMDTYNRMRFWMKPPQTQPASTQAGGHNSYFGTYTRSTQSARNSAESGNGHWYHRYEIRPNGHWHQVIVDMHPHHQRGLPGSTEHGVKEYPTGEEGLNYFDSLTRFYWDVYGSLSAYPSDFLFSNFEFYNQPEVEAVDEVYSVHGSYDAVNEVFNLGWSRRKDRAIAHEVAFSFVNLHEEGSTFTPEWEVQPPHGGDYNGMILNPTGIDITGRDSVFFGIRPKGDVQFRQIQVPITAAGYNSMGGV